MMGIQSLPLYINPFTFNMWFHLNNLNKAGLPVSDQQITSEAFIASIEQAVDCWQKGGQTVC